MNYIVEYFSPVTRQGGIVSIRNNGVMQEKFSKEDAEAIAAYRNLKYKPLQYAVKESK